LKNFKLFEDIQNTDYIPADETELNTIDTPYKTNIAITAEDQIVSIPKKGKKSKIQKTDYPKNFDIPKRKDTKRKFIQDQDMTQDEEANQQMPAQDPSAMGGGMDQSAAMGGGMDQYGGMGGGMGTEPDFNMPKTDEQIGRIFELKKIYKRLLSLDTYLSFSSDPVLIKLRGFTTNAVELFEVLIANILKYQDKIDDVIIIYYKFLNLVYSVIKVYYKRKQEKEKNEDIK
jgi:hypothetical protein